MPGHFVPRLTRKEQERRRMAAGRELLERGHIYGAKAEIARKYGVSTAAVAHWWNIIQAEGLEGLARSTNPPGFPTWLTDEDKQRLSQMLIEGAMKHGFEDDIWTGKRVAQLIKDEFGVEYSDKYIPTLLKDQLGFSYQKPARRPREIDEEKVETWLRTEWEDAKKGRSRTRRRSGSATNPAPT